MHIIEFSYERRRMSVIVKNLLNNEINLYTKGADSIFLFISGYNLIT